MTNLNIMLQNLPAFSPAIQPGSRHTLKNSPKTTAGTLMKSGFVSIRPDLAAAEAIKVLHQLFGRRHQNTSRVSCIYVTDEEDRLMGVFSLTSLISACPGVLVSDFMDRDLVSVRPYDDQATVARTVVRHDLSTVPVVDEQDRLLGIVNAEDALAGIIPANWRKRLLRYSR